jgi:hypothetical protein
MLNHSSNKKRSAHLYRNASILVFAALIIFSSISFWLAPIPAQAQSKKQKGPRALSVVAWSGDTLNPDPVTSVLQPVGIYVDGHFYDASMYHAQPAPLAIDPGVIYDVLRNGDLLGSFTVGTAREQRGVWYGVGHYESKEAAAAKAKPAPAPKVTAQPEERPVLRRGTPPPPAPAAQTDAVLNTIDRDPDRPTLHRHSATDEKKPSPPEPTPPVTSKTHMLPAISTESGPDYHSFKFHEKAGETDQLRAEMEKLARAELQKGHAPPPAFSSKGSSTKSVRSKNSVSAPQLELQNPVFGVYDVNSNNAPILVFSATAMVDGTKKYVTVAAWEEIDQSLRKVFAQVTDDHHLDVYPRLEVIDAVDARGIERGELLFRAFGDQGSRFVLYHPGPDSLELLFDSARGES